MTGHCSVPGCTSCDGMHKDVDVGSVQPLVGNEERTCRNNHTYVTSAGEPGKCWCGAPPKLVVAK